MSAREHKAALRKTQKAKRQAMPAVEVVAKSAAIADHLVQTDLWQQARTVCAYVSCGNEVATHALIQDSILAGKTILVPKVAGKVLYWYALADWNSLAPGTFGILEPVTEKTIALRDPQPDLVLVPGLAFDSGGQRLGYGAGHYDRFLEQLKTKTIGLAYDWQVLDTLPCEPHDVPLDGLITETGLREMR